MADTPFIQKNAVVINKDHRVYVYHFDDKIDKVYYPKGTGDSVAVHICDQFEETIIRLDYNFKDNRLTVIHDSTKKG
jgi:hypothetical protein